MKVLEKIFTIVTEVLLFAALFVLSGFVVNQVLNRNADDVSHETGDPMFPEVCIYRDGRIINSLEGYTTKINTSLDRSDIVPLDAGKSLSVMVENDYEGRVRYELRDITGEQLIENGDMEKVGTVNAEKQNGFIRVSGVNTGNEGKGDSIYSISLRMDMKQGAEYTFAVLLDCDGKTVRYYTRIVTLERDFLSKMLDYSVDYNGKIFPSTSKDAGEEEQQYETLEETVAKNEAGEIPDRTKLWGKLNPILVTTIIPTVKEVSATTALIELKYVVESDDTGNVIEYGIDDYLYLSYDNSTDTVSLTKNVRYIDEIFTSDNIPLGEKSEHEFRTDRSSCKWSENEEMGAFTQAGELWFYDRKKGTGARLYGSGSKNREADFCYFCPVTPHIISVDNDGVLYFSVVGRQNYGRLEGKNGIALYCYEAKKTELSILFFVETSDSYEALGLGAERFNWYDPDKREFYVVLDESLQVYNISNGNVTKISADMPEDMIFASENGECVAFPDTAEDTGADEIVLMNMTDMGEYHLKHDGRKLRIIGFKDDVLVYGASKTSDIRVGSDGQPDFMYSEVYIVDKKGECVREYKKSGLLVSDVELTSNDLRLVRVSGGAGKYDPAPEDHLIYKTAEPEEDITLPNLLYQRSRLPEMIVREKADGFVTATCKPAVKSGRVFVYSDEGLKESFGSLGRAMVYLEKNGGIVVSAEGELIYGIKESAPYLTVAGTFEYIACDSAKDSLAACAVMSMRCAGVKTENVKLDDFGNDGSGDGTGDNSGDGSNSGTGTNSEKKGYVEMIAENTDVIEGLNISGATVDAAISFLSDGIPFTVKMPEGQYVLVVSYNANYIRYYDPVLGKEVRTSRSGFTADVVEAGGEIYVYRYLR
ncbi:MAG: hypothetical protein IJJ74_07275 [Eubacterium sp.]|nr:hypothetical protein [Eubacterium sp.]